MRIRLKLSVTHDLDFICLMQCRFPLTEWIRISLKSYVEENRLSVIPLPSFPSEITAEKSVINFSLHPEKDAEVIKWLNQIRVGQRSGAIKSVFRCSLAAPCLAGHYIKPDDRIIDIKDKTPSASKLPITATESSITPKTKKKPQIPAIQEPVSEAAAPSDDFDIFTFQHDNF